MAGEAEVTDEMINAGVAEMMGNFLSLTDIETFPGLVRTLYLRMAALAPEPDDFGGSPSFETIDTEVISVSNLYVEMKP